jgi:hypothetical protein
MGHIVVWALSTGLVTGAVWVGILAVARGRRVADRQALAAAAEQRLAELAELGDRVTEAESRVDYAEQTLLRRRAASPPPPNR